MQEIRYFSLNECISSNELCLTILIYFKLFYLYFSISLRIIFDYETLRINEITIDNLK